MKHQYLSQLRRDTCYPSFRSFVGLFKVIGYLLAIVAIAAGFMSGNGLAMVLGVVVGVIVVLLVTAIAEGSSMLADIADSTLEQASQQIEIEQVNTHVAPTPNGGIMRPTDLADMARGGGFAHR